MAEQEPGPAVSKLLALANVKGYNRRSRSGKLVQVDPYAAKRGDNLTVAQIREAGEQKFGGRVVSFNELRAFLTKILGRVPTTVEIQRYAKLFQVKQKKES